MYFEPNFGRSQPKKHSKCEKILNFEMFSIFSTLHLYKITQKSQGIQKQQILMHSKTHANVEHDFYGINIFQQHTALD